MARTFDNGTEQYIDSYGEVDDDHPFMPAELDWLEYSKNLGRYENWLGAEKNRLATTGGQGAAAMRAGLGQAQTSMFAQANARGANPQAERAALYAGGQMQRQGALQAAQMTQQEYAQMREMEQGYRSQQIQNSMQQQAMEMQRQQMMSNNYNAAVGADIAQTNADWSHYGGVVGTVAGAAAASDVRVKENVRPQGGQPADEAIRTLGNFDDSAQLVSASEPLPTNATKGTPATGFQAMYGGAPKGAAPTGQDFSARAMSQPQAATQSSQETARLLSELEAENAAMRQRIGGAAQAGGSTEGFSSGVNSGLQLGAALSDERTKSGRALPEDEAQDRMMRETDLYTYNYRPEWVDHAAQVSGAPREAKARGQVGVMAQDLERTPLGRKLVVRDPQTGMRAIDGSQAIPTSLGLIGRLGERADELEARLQELEARRGVRRQSKPAAR